MHQSPASRPARPSHLRHPTSAILCPAAHEKRALRLTPALRLATPSTPAIPHNPQRACAEGVWLDCDITDVRRAAKCG